MNPLPPPPQQIILVSNDVLFSQLLLCFLNGHPFYLNNAVAVTPVELFKQKLGDGRKINLILHADGLNKVVDLELLNQLKPSLFNKVILLFNNENNQQNFLFGKKVTLLNTSNNIATIIIELKTHLLPKQDYDKKLLMELSYLLKKLETIHRHYDFTGREIYVLQLIKNDFSNKQIEWLLKISKPTLDRTLEQIANKLHASHHKTDIIVKALEQRILVTDEKELVPDFEHLLLRNIGIA